ncbi:hypothetical protein BGZ54_004588, partial [Gamsiella multidivaricata]
NPCSNVPICAPAAGEVWAEDSLESVIWNPKMMYPFDQYDKVDIYIVDEGNDTRTFLLQDEADLSLGMMATRLDSQFFPEDLPSNRSCHVLMTGVGNALDGTHRTLNSSSFLLIRRH